jgi:hypothetical protein
MKTLILTTYTFIAILCATNAQESQSKNHFVGELFGGGIVFYVDHTNQHGLICSLIDLSKSQNWSNVHLRLIGPDSQSDWDGLKNSNAIVSQENHKMSAAELCLDYVNKDYGTGSFSDWYLPTIDDLNILFNNKRFINKTIESDGNELTEGLSKAKYWSSTEYTNEQAWCFNFTYGIVDGSLTKLYYHLLEKRNQEYVRAIREF